MALHISKAHQTLDWVNVAEVCERPDGKWWIVNVESGEIVAEIDDDSETVEIIKNVLTTCDIKVNHETAWKFAWLAEFEDSK